ncbi:helix-turn-helix transcriptional regulator [Saccharopolyspora erythraea]|uniref:TetR/AcrR family transcriptional regulator n=1 Tax=Saccharopolyspora erythraea TaxID=1836 RepID=UPI001BAD0C8C|nr:TetR/AcrR family transcriptional regulator [Saccharopolyspora erythraea]QUH02496.1 helix-turn-helix transcriptional regulator [Saccharopolyspora erythraea]
MAAKKAKGAADKILDAALVLFVERGYSSATMDMIAKKAGVAVQTVYFTFQNKTNILKRLIDLTVAGDDEPVPTLERAWVREVIEEPDPVRHLELQVKGTAKVYRRVASLLNVLSRASDTDPTVAELWSNNQEQRRIVQRRFLLALRKKQALPKGLTLQRAVDISFTILGPEVFELLVVDRGWSVPEWERWAVSTLRFHLLS